MKKARKGDGALVQKLLHLGGDSLSVSLDESTDTSQYLRAFTS